MKRLLALLLLCAGCTSTQLTNTNGTAVKRTSFLTKTAIGKVTISKDGAVSMSAYSQQGDTEMLAIIVEAAVKAAAAAATGKP
jgi:hypothetical protein